ncbi:insulinase family protein [Erythrobacter sp. 3-20A1M]|uniref:insulinase family protein n=1 Tax=Erythrobacter sp. 3-20A1M TaxID=2653850 RepID=UPI0035303718
MNRFSRAARPFAALVSFALLTAPAAAQDVAPQPQDLAPQPIALPEPTSIQGPDETPWLYEGSDIPVDREWVFGKLDNGLRYAVRHNGVPPGQVSIRIRIDAGSLYEKDSEQGFAHLIEHMTFRQSTYLGFGEAIPTWQRLGASFGTDTNAQTSPTQTLFSLDLPDITPTKLDDSMRYLSGMIRAPSSTTRLWPPISPSCSPKCARAAARACASPSNPARRCSPGNGWPNGFRSGPWTSWRRRLPRP